MLSTYCVSKYGLTDVILSSRTVKTSPALFRQQIRYITVHRPPRRFKNLEHCLGSAVPASRPSVR